MLYILEDNTIRLTRGDTAAITVTILDDISGKEYELKFTDTLKLSVKKTVKDEEYCFQKEVTGSNNIVIEPDDTSALAFGKYKYDVELKLDTGAVSTIIEPSTFEILPEVTCK